MKIRSLLVAVVSLALVGPAAATSAGASTFADGCEITPVVPARLAIEAPSQTFPIDLGNPLPCMGHLNTPFGAWDTMQQNQAYQARTTTGTYVRHSLYKDVPKKVQVEALYTTLDLDWAVANGQVGRTPRVNPSNVMDVRYKSFVTASASRVLGQVKVTGKATRYELPSYAEPVGSPGSRVANAGAVVAVQKLAGSTWVTKKRARTTKSGAYTAYVPDTGAGSWRVVVADTGVAFGTTSGGVGVARAKAGRVKVAGVKAKRSGAKVTVKAKVTTKVGGKTVAAPGVQARVQVKAGGKWRTVKTVRTSSAGTVTAKVKSRSRAVYRVVVPKQKAIKAATASKSVRR